MTQLDLDHFVDSIKTLVVAPFIVTVVVLIIFSIFYSRGK